MLLAQKKPTIVVINSLVARGSVGGRGSVFALERLGFPVWFVPTVTLPWHPGHGPATRSTTPIRDFAAILDDLANSSFLDEVGAVVSGYLADPGQAEAVECFVAIARERNPDLVYLCDPIAGDKGALYVPEEIATAIRDTLLPAADIVTPNLFELSWLAGNTVESATGAIVEARKLPSKKVLVSSVPGFLRNGIGNLLVTENDAVLAENTVIAGGPNGPGDLLAALFLARTLEGRDGENALSKASSSTYELIARSVKRGENELAIAAEQIALEKPMAMVTIRHVSPGKTHD